MGHRSFGGQPVVANRFAIIVEGGGRTREGRRKLRASMRSLIGTRHDIVPGGGTPECIGKLRDELSKGRQAVILIDSGQPTTPPGTVSPWKAVGHQPPAGARDEHCHLMVTCMEAWILADRTPVRTKYGQQLQESKLPNDPVCRTENELEAALKSATDKCSGNKFEKRHTFELLAACDPALIRRQCPWAERFFNAIGARG